VSGKTGKAQTVTEQRCSSEHCLMGGLILSS
jgi:hypothetical protein